MSSELITVNVHKLNFFYFQPELYKVDGEKIDFLSYPKDLNKFALRLIREIKGSQYLMTHLWEPTFPSRSNKEAMDADTVKFFKDTINVFFNNVNWDNLKEVINRAGRDEQKKSKHKNSS